MRISPRLRAGLDDRGVALPVALFGLVAVSVLVSSALVTSSTELALSRAHQDGTRSLHAADDALEQFVAQRAGMVVDPHLRLAAGGYPLGLPSGTQFTVNVAELFRSAVVTLPDGSMERRETYSLVASPQNGRGRSVGALIDATRTASAISLNIDSGLTLGTNTTVTGSATISDGSSAGAACDSTTATAAIRHADSTTVTRQGASNDIYGSIIEDNRSAEELMNHVLNGYSIDDLSNLAHIRFGPMFTQPAFAGNPGQTALDTKYRWGCPSQLVAGCSGAQASYYPTVVIDANGTEIDLRNYHGQGILLIRNGDVHIRGDFNYMGIIVVEGRLTVTGTPRLEGAVIAMGDEAIISPGDETLASGTSLIRYNRCQIVNAQQGLTLNSLDFTAQTMDMPTFAWFEVVR